MKTGEKTGCVIWAIIGLVVILFLVRQIIHERKLKPFQGHVSEYESIIDSAVPHAGGSGYIRGKVVIVNAREPEENLPARIDYRVFFNLPEEMRAKRPDEVGSVVALQWGKEIVGSFSDGTTAHFRTCQVTIVDKEKRQIIGEKFFKGSAPPKSKTRGGSRSGSTPYHEIINYLKDLARK